MPTRELIVAPGNEAQAQAWDGDEGEIWARYPEFFESSVRRHQAKLMEAAALTAEARVLDIGCGTGDSTRDAARAAKRGAAVGIDLSARMLERARAAARDLTNATFVQGDAQTYPFEPGSFDVAISRTGAMFFADQTAAFTNIARAMRAGGRLALVSWQGPERNERFLSFVDALTLGGGLAPPPPNAPSPFAHADPSRTEQILTGAGFADVRIDPLELPMYFGATADDGYEVLSRLLAWMTGTLAEGERARAFRRLRDTLVAHETPDGVTYRSSAWLITAERAGN
jgi:SAM-dependent methyltransferase